MKTLKILATILLLPVMSARIAAQITITESGNDIIVNFALPSYQIKDTIDTDLFGSTVYKYIDIEDFGLIVNEGFPELPQLTIDLAVDDNTYGYSVATSNLVVTETTLNHSVYPSQEYEVGDNSVVLPIINTAYYQSNGSAYNFRYALTDSFRIMGVKGVSLSIFPFVYVPNQNKLKIMTSGTFTLSYSRTSGAKSITELSPNKADFLSRIFANYNYITARSTGSGTPEKYIIITPEKFVNTLTYFANYKRNLGYDVSVVSTSTIGNTKTDITNYLAGVSQKDYVLLVGNISNIPASKGTVGDGSDTNNPLTDLYYSVWNDSKSLVPDLFLGRWPVKEIYELKSIINKTIYMETYMNTFEKKAVLLSGKRADNSTKEVNQEAVFCKSINWVARTAFSSASGWTAKKYHGKDPTNPNPEDDAMAALNENYLYLVYSGHGNNISLAPPHEINKSKIDAATNTRYPMVFSSACKGGNYGNTDPNGCVGEYWMRVIPKNGAVSFFGASVEVNLLAGSAFNQGVLGARSNSNNLGEMIVAGKKQYFNNVLRQAFASDARIKRHMEMFNLFGDPSFKLSGIDSYANLVLAADDVIPLGGKVTYSATESITNEGSFVIDPGAEVEFTAGESIVLMPGFVAEAGSKFTAEIKPVTQSRSIRVTPEEREEFLEIIAAENEAVIANNYACCVFPNPVTDMAIVRLEAPEPCSVSIYVYDAGGIPVQSLQNQEMDDTVQFFNLPFDDQPRGVYLYRIVAGEKQYEGKIIKL